MTYTINNEKFEFITILEDEENATLFRHFKGKLYKIVLIAKDSENLEDIVVYQQQYDDFAYFTRKASMFFSNVDKEKYPNVLQEKRFMMI